MSAIPVNEEKLSGLELLQIWIAEHRRPPFGDVIEFDLVEIEAGRAVFEATPSPRTYNPAGTVHGGYTSTLLDSACGCAAHSMLSAGQSYTTVELKVAFHRPIRAEVGRLRAEAKVISLGRRVAFTEGKLSDANGRLYASATSTLLIYDRSAEPAK